MRSHESGGEQHGFLSQPNARSRGLASTGVSSRWERKDGQDGYAHRDVLLGNPALPRCGRRRGARDGTLSGTRGREVHVFTRPGYGSGGVEQIDGVWYHYCPRNLNRSFVDEMQDMCRSVRLAFLSNRRLPWSL